jgi:hypothetical protein
MNSLEFHERYTSLRRQAGPHIGYAVLAEQHIGQERLHIGAVWYAPPEARDRLIAKAILANGNDRSKALVTTADASADLITNGGYSKWTAQLPVDSEWATLRLPTVLSSMDYRGAEGSLSVPAEAWRSSEELARYAGQSLVLPIANSVRSSSLTLTHELSVGKLLLPIIEEQNS